MSCYTIATAQNNVHIDIQAHIDIHAYVWPLPSYTCTGRQDESQTGCDGVGAGKFIPLLLHLLVPFLVTFIGLLHM